jgi:prolipoprotein diacylglyceryltransferase
MPEDLTALQVLAAYLRCRVEHLRREETGALSLEWVAVIIAALMIVTTVVAIIRAKATAGANRISIP